MSARNSFEEPVVVEDDEIVVPTDVDEEVTDVEAEEVVVDAEPAEAEAAAPEELSFIQTFDNENLITEASERPESLVKIFRYVDENEERFIKNLREAVAVQSISVLPEARNECYRMIQVTMDRLRGLGFEVELRKVGTQECNGTEIPHPPVILASKGNDPKKMNLLVYGHLDVQPAKRSDGWYCEPFYLTEEGNCLYGRGASDDKGPVMGWIHAVEAYVKSSIRLPVNLKFVFESMSESGSEGLAELLKNQKDRFFADIDLVTLSDNYWLGKTKPCITYGLRGLCYFFCEVEMGTKDLHSGVFGGTVREALPDLIWLLNQLVDANGTIRIPEILDDVCPLLPEEEAIYRGIDFDLEDYQTDAGLVGLRFPGDKNATLMNRWRFPALTIHGIQGAFDSPGTKVVIPRKVIGKFSIRIVPNQTPDRIELLVKTFLKAKWEERGSPNTFRIYMADEGLMPWCANPFHPSFKAARQATAWAYGKAPDMIREGGSLERVLKFQEVTGKNVILLPMGASDDAAHYVNEKINVSNYITGTKLFAAFIHEVGKMARGEM